MKIPVKPSQRIMLTLNCLVWLFAGYSIGIHLRAWHNRPITQLTAAPCAPQTPVTADGVYHYDNFHSGHPGADEGLTK